MIDIQSQIPCSHELRQYNRNHRQHIHTQQLKIQTSQTMHMESFGFERTPKITESHHKPNVMPIKAQNAYLETSQVLRIFFF